MNSLTNCVIIPARYASSRFPGKPLVVLHGKPMILWVAEAAAKAVGGDHVFIATEDSRIAEVVRQGGYKAVMTSTTALTGTDRLAEAAAQLDYDILVNVQGDEPLIDPDDIRRCIEIKRQNPDQIVNGFCWMAPDENPLSVNIPKVIADESGRMVYMSRSALPGFKDPKNAPTRYLKQVCIYGFNREELASFAAFGRKGHLEEAEDIEILRFLDIGRPVLMYECRGGSLAVDVPEDVARVECVLKHRALSH